MRFFRIILSILFLHCICVGWGADADARFAVQLKQEEVDSTEAKVYFRKGYYGLDMNYADNQDNLIFFIARMRELQQDKHVRIRKIRVRSSVSPEGDWRKNQQLSKRRGETLRSYLIEKLPDLADVVDVRSIGMNWQELDALVEEDMNVPYREEVLQVLRGAAKENIRPQLLTLRGQKPWSYMYANLFPEMRNATMLICYFARQLDFPDSIYSLKLKTMPTLAQRPGHGVHSSDKMKNLAMLDWMVGLKDGANGADGANGEHFADGSNGSGSNGGRFANGKDHKGWALKSNLLFDGALLPNLGVEKALSRRLSVDANWVYGWWSEKASRFIHAYGGDAGLRWWFGSNYRPVLTGHHLGLTATLFKLDVKLSDQGAVTEKWNYGAGLEYGYSFALSRRLNLDLSFGFGYLGGEYKRYERQDDCDVWQATLQRHYIGPIKVAVSLVWQLDGLGRKRGGGR